MIYVFLIRQNLNVNEHFFQMFSNPKNEFKLK